MKRQREFVKARCPGCDRVTRMKLMVDWVKCRRCQRGMRWVEFLAVNGEGVSLLSAAQDDIGTPSDV